MWVNNIWRSPAPKNDPRLHFQQLRTEKCISLALTGPKLGARKRRQLKIPSVLSSPKASNLGLTGNNGWQERGEGGKWKEKSRYICIFHPYFAEFHFEKKSLQGDASVWVGVLSKRVSKLSWASFWHWTLRVKKNKNWKQTICEKSKILFLYINRYLRSGALYVISHNKQTRKGALR